MSLQRIFAAMTDRPWHVLTTDEALERLRSTPDGLTSAEASRRQQQYGPNELSAISPTSAWRTLAEQFKNVLVLILLAATALSALLGETLEAAVIAVIVLFAVGLGFAQEYRASRALEALQRMAAPSAHVRRHGTVLSLAAREVVPGDIVLLNAGDRVPADVRLLAAVNLSVDEAALTGESTAVRKSTVALPDPSLGIGDRVNMAYAGTLAVQGRGEGVVVSTGGATEFGAISRMVQEVAPGRTPLQNDLDRVGRLLGKAALVIVGVIVGLGVWRGEPVFDMFMFGIALAVAVVPEALPAVVTISLAIGVRRMVKRNALVRRLPVVETLGTTSIICSDKTGTLTRNEMTARQLYVGDRLIRISGTGYAPEGEFLDADERPLAIDDDLREALRAAVLASDARLTSEEGRWRIEGDPTEGALIVAAAKAALDPEDLRRRWRRIDEVPFSSERRRMTTVNRDESGAVAYSKGAADVVLADCVEQWRNGAPAPLDSGGRERVLRVEHDMAAEGLRVLALARKQTEAIAGAEQGMTFLGLVGMMDPPRREARDAVAQCASAGITPVIVTGDHPLTTRAVARELGILNGRVISGADLQDLSDEQLGREVEHISVYARVSPADKLRVVSAWQQRGAVVAVTGDGVNDAPALKKADVGVAMGITGTDVSKEAAGMTLLDDNFATIVAAIEEGRIVFANIRKYLGYLLSSNVGEILLMVAATLAGLPLPLTAVQILYVNLATDGLPALALAVDPPEEDVMQRRPRDPRRGVFTPELLTLVLAGGVWSGFVTTGLFAWQLAAGRELRDAMALTFVALVLIQFFKAYNFRSLRRSMLHDFFGNRWLDAAIAWELLLLAAILYVPWLQTAFGTFALSPADWLLTGIAAASIVPVLELVKLLQRRRA